MVSLKIHSWQFLQLLSSFRDNLDHFGEFWLVFDKNDVIWTVVNQKLSKKCVFLRTTVTKVECLNVGYIFLFITRKPHHPKINFKNKTPMPLERLLCKSAIGPPFFSAVFAPKLFFKQILQKKYHIFALFSENTRFFVAFFIHHKK